MNEALLEVDDLKRHYRLPRESLFAPAPVVAAVDGVSFRLKAGRSFGIVGESGSGKSTLGRTIMALEPPTAGHVRLLGRDLNALAPEDLRRARQDMQMVFQDPYGSLDPRQKTGRIVAEPLSALSDASPAERRERVAEALVSVGLRAADMDKYPHEFSGGQRQRIAIARALITRPKLIVADEPVSALDVSVQAQVLNLLRDLQETFARHLHSDQPRPGGGRLCVRRHRRHASRPLRRGGEVRADSAGPRASLYAGLARGDSEAGAGEAEAAE